MNLHGDPGELAPSPNEPLRPRVARAAGHSAGWRVPPAMRPLLATGALLGACAAPGAGTGAAPDAPAAEVSARTGVVTPPSDRLPARPMTLAECIDVALTSRGTVARAERQVLIARNRRDETFAAILPRSTLELRGETRSNDRGAKFPGRDPQVTGDPTTGVATLATVVPIYDFGASLARIDIEESRIRAAGSDSVRVRQDLALAVAQTYFRVLEARRIVGVVEESLRTLDAQLRSARDFERAGLVARSDVLTAEVQLARRRQDAIEARNNVELATATLNRVMGAPVDRATEIVDVLETSAWDGPLGRSLAEALERRPDLAALRERVVGAQAAAAAANAGMRPGIYGFLDVSHTTDSLTLNPDWATVGLGVRWSLFDGWANDARKAQRRDELRDTEDALSEAEADVALDVRLAWQDVREAAERIPVARQTVALAEENLRVVRDQYGAGLVTTADTLAEEERLASSRAASFRALYDYHDAMARLAHAVGADPRDAGGSGR